MSLSQLLRQQDNVISRLRALQYLSAGTIRHSLASGRWVRVQLGIYATHTGPLSSTARNWVAVLAAGGDRDPAGVCLAGVSALRAWGLRGIEPAAIDLLVRLDARVRPQTGVVVYRTRNLPDLTCTRHLRPPASLAGRSLVDAVQWARSDLEARLLIAASFQQGMVSLADVTHAAAEQPRLARRDLLLHTATDCAGGSHSLAELDLLDLCRRAKLPPPARQVRRYDRQGRLRFLDAAFDPWKVAIEVDGAHHLDVAQLWDDAERSNALELDGYLVLSYPAFAVRARQPRIAAEIREALIAAGWRPATR